MPPKRAILNALTHEELIDLAELSSVEISHTNELIDRGRRSAKTALRTLLNHYPPERLKEICQAVGVDHSGDDRSSMLERLLWSGTSEGHQEARSWSPLLSQKSAGRKKATASSTWIEATASRSSFAINFPKVVGFSVAKEALRCDVTTVEMLRIEPIGPVDAPVQRTEAGWIVPASAESRDAEVLSRARFYEEHPFEKSVAWIAAYIVEILAGGRVPMANPPRSELRLLGARALFEDVRDIVHGYLKRRVRLSKGARLEDIAFARYRDAIIERIVPKIELDSEAGQPLLLPVFDENKSVCSTADVTFRTSRATHPTSKSHVTHVTLEGNWADSAEFFLEESANVSAYVKNDQPHFGILYEHKATTHRYTPDFLVRLAETTWILELGRPPGEDDEARWTATAKWIRAINNHGGFGPWKHVICRDAGVLRKLLASPAPPIEDDGSSYTNGKPSRSDNDKEWWERARSHGRSSNARSLGFHITGAMAIAPPETLTTTAGTSASASADQNWAIPCRCGESWCDGVRYVSASSGGVSLQFVYAHPGDPSAERTRNWLIRFLAKKAVEDVVAQTNNLPEATTSKFKKSKRSSKPKK